MPFPPHTRDGGHIEPGIWTAATEVDGERFVVPVDLIVPEAVAPLAVAAGLAWAFTATVPRAAQSGWRPRSSTTAR